MLESIAFRKFCWLSSFGDYRLHSEILLFVYCYCKLNLGPIPTRGVLDCCLNLRNIRIQKCLKRECVLSLCLSFSKSGMAGLVSPGGQEDGNKTKSATHMAFLVIISECTLLYLQLLDQIDYCAP